MRRRSGILPRSKCHEIVIAVSSKSKELWLMREHTHKTDLYLATRDEKPSRSFDSLSIHPIESSSNRFRCIRAGDKHQSQ
mmetsp:Transcript_5022/g.8920  ORF Transcript_5022/g.8920 Transcript_5022/m.8920 type:complete len:80 (+) Transcript_5022:337-576(+)